MSTVPSADAKAVVRAAEALTTQVRRIADALSTPVVRYEVATDDGPTTTPDDTTTPLRLTTPCAVCTHPYNWHKEGVCQVDDCACIAFALGAVKASVPIPRPAEVIEDERALREYEAAALHRQGVISDRELNAVFATAAEDAQRTARRDSASVLLARGERMRLTTEEVSMLRQHFADEAREVDTARQQRDQARGERDRSDEAARRALEQRQEMAEERHAWQRRGENAERELRTLRTGIRALGGDPTTVQNLWAQLRLRNRQWAEAKREVRVTRSMLEAEGGDVALVDEMLATVAKAEGEAREAQAAIERVRQTLQEVLATFAVGAAYGERPTYTVPREVDRETFERWCAALDGAEQPTTETAPKLPRLGTTETSQSADSPAIETGH